MRSRSVVFGDFGLPSARQLGARDFAVAVAAASVILLLCLELASMLVAHQLHHARTLGEPLFYIGAEPVWPPWSVEIWRRALATHAPNHPAVQRASATLLLSVSVSLLALGLILLSRLRRLANRASALHGTGHLATPKEVQRSGLLHSPRRNEKRVNYIYLALYADHSRGLRRLLRDGSTRHVAVVAPPRSGKFTGPVASTAVTWGGSLVVNDPKSEIWEATSGFRRSQGQTVHCYAPAAAPGRSARWNFLAEIRQHTCDETADAQQIAGQLLDDAEGSRFRGENGIWAQAAREVLVAAFLHVLYRNSVQGLPTASINDVRQELKNPTLSYEDVLNEWQSFTHDPSDQYGWTLPDGTPTGTHPVVASCAMAQLGMDERTRASVKFTVDTALALFEDEKLLDNHSESDFSIESLINAETPTSLYVVYPMSDVQRLGPVLRLFYQVLTLRATADLAYESGRAKRANRHQLLLLLDEFTNLGRLHALEAGMAVSPAYGVRVMAVFQTIEQLRTVYGQNQTILALCHTQVFYPPTTLETAKAMSERTGRQTAIKRGQRTRKGPQPNDQEIARAVLDVDECMRLPGPQFDRSGELITKAGNVLIFTAGCATIFGEQLLWWEDATLKRMLSVPAPSRVPVHPSTGRLQDMLRVRAPELLQDTADAPIDQDVAIASPSTLAHDLLDMLQEDAPLDGE